MKIDARGLACVRGDRLVFEDVSFRLGAGQALFVTGANGSGKSSLLRLLAGFVPVHSGTIEVAAEGGARLDRLADLTPLIHYQGHVDPVKPGLTVAEHLAFWAQLEPADGGADALAPLGLGPLVDVPGRYLSAGQRRRLCLARLILARKALWLLDEPAAPLDDDGVARLEAIMRRHIERDGLLMCATHRPFDLPGAQTLRLGG